MRVSVLLVCVVLVLPILFFPGRQVCHGAGSDGGPAIEERAVVLDDGNNLREFGGPSYRNARIIGVLNQGDVVTVHRREGRWSMVTTSEGILGWVHSSCLKTIAPASEAPGGPGLQTCPQDMSRRFLVDLNGDGRNEIITMIDLPSPEGGDARLVVRDHQGRSLWEGPTGESPFLFICRDWGFYWPNVIGDIDGDGVVELLAQQPQSDVSPSSFFMARWTGAGFVPVSRGWSLLENPMGSGRFVKAQYTYDGKPVSWIMDVELLKKNGELRVTVYQDNGGGNVRTGKAWARMDEGGARIIRWSEPMQ